MKNQRRAFLGQLFAAAAVVCILTRPQAKGDNRRRRNRVQPLSKKGNAAELPVVRAVGANSITVGKKRYVLSEFADIIVNGEKATLKDVKVGMQVMVTGGVKERGDTQAETTYKATRIVARSDNKLQQKAKEANRKAAEAARKANQRKNNAPKKK